MPTIPEVLAQIAAKEIELEDLYEAARQVKLTEYFAAVAVIEGEALSSDDAQTALQNALQTYIREIADIG